MLSPIPDYLSAILDEVRDLDGGEVAQYIPELKDADPEKLSLALCTTSGHMYSVGDDDVEFSMQSVSKPFAYALALDERGPDEVFEVVGVEPSGEAFNELSLEESSKRPDNAMINAGAIAVNQLINGETSTVDDRTERFRQLYIDLAGRELRLNEELVEAEMQTADRNLSIAHMLRSYDVIKDEAHDAVRSYIAQCSFMVTTRDLAVMAATLANGGVQPVTEKRVFSEKASRLALAVMSSAGMYDAAGRWMANVGIPAKSGVSGGLIGTMPGQMGIATLSPRLDLQGNSVRGVEAFERLSDEMGLHLMSANYYTAPGIRSIDVEGDSTVISLQGMINFPSAENIIYQLSEQHLMNERLVLDVSHVTGFNKMGRRVVKEGLRRFRENGMQVAIYDPDSVMTDLQFSDGTHAEEVEDFSTTFEVDAPVDKAFAAVAHPSQWWAKSIKAKAGDEGETFEVDIPEHYSHLRVTECEPGERLVWHVDPTGHEDEQGEWKDTDLIFEFEEKGDKTEITFTHRGMQEHLETYDQDTSEWKRQIAKGLIPLIDEGKGEPLEADN